MPRITKVYTRTGDDGTTALTSGERVGKDDLRVQVYGTVDELNAALGVALASNIYKSLKAPLELIRNELFHLGAELSLPDPDRRAGPKIDEKHVHALETLMDRLSEELEPLTNFVLPGGSLAAASLHLARAICRRTERILVALSRKERVRPASLRYVNRLSDALFVLARYENHKKGIHEPLWDSRA
jgi:cob(I)alamin adenosyltransferase